MDNLRMIEDIEFQPNDEGQPSEETAKQEGLQTGDVLATRIEAIDSSKHEHPTALWVPLCHWIMREVDQY